jgi:hypothetical protein
MAELWTPPTTPLAEKYQFSEPKADNTLLRNIERIMTGNNSKYSDDFGRELLNKLAVAPIPVIPDARKRSSLESSEHSPDLANIQNLFLELLRVLGEDQVDCDDAEMYLEAFVAAISHTQAFCSKSPEHAFSPQVKKEFECARNLLPDLLQGTDKLVRSVQADLERWRRIQLVPVTDSTETFQAALTGQVKATDQVEVLDRYAQFRGAVDTINDLIGDFLNPSEIEPPSEDKKRGALEEIDRQLVELIDNIDDSTSGNPEDHEEIIDLKSELERLRGYIFSDQSIEDVLREIIDDIFPDFIYLD